MNRRVIDMDASKWNHVLDFYNDILKQVEAPEWHGKSVNALVDSMIYGDINHVEPPYTIRIRGVDSLPDKIAKELKFAKKVIEAARLDQRNTTGVDSDVEFELA